MQRELLHRSGAAAEPARLRTKHAESSLRDPLRRWIEFLRIAPQRRQHYDQRPAAFRDDLDCDVIATDDFPCSSLRVNRTSAQYEHHQRFHGYEFITRVKLL